MDTIAVPASDSMRLVVVGAPSYLEEHPPPEHPRDLHCHVCINCKHAADADPYRSEFTEDGTHFSITPGGGTGRLRSRR